MFISIFTYYVGQLVVQGFYKRKDFLNSAYKLPHPGLCRGMMDLSMQTLPHMRKYNDPELVMYCLML
jgi:hypothetical protein